ncbi:DUF389 domain-containing protein [Microlunatus flavus]|uniref:Uncharacterized hydrophobic domain-containing protein n=1 Tax=Microlunatus flavus TaxID=1036181 RepID=A0A1H9AIX1_9ACTN|nr:DUF389 domain-containing protein [Microlunatus flavus]SEP76619.1 uncharacterized hydrophobic domain-containing protein [Microlunatus flavus]
MLNLRLVVPAPRAEAVVATLVDDPRVTDVVHLPGAALRPLGDVVSCDVTREAASDVLGWLRREGLFDEGSVVISDLSAAPSVNAREVERAATGAPDDAIIWDAVVDNAYGEVRGSYSFYAFLTLAVTIAAVAVVTDSSILVVGAMVVGPEFAVVAALAVGLVARRPGLLTRAARLLAQSFAVAIGLTLLLALLARALGWVHLEDVTGPRPLTGFVWRPDLWSAVVAVLAGCAGVLSQTGGRTNALVGVFISVTTVPAAGDFALSLAVGAFDQLPGAAAQLGINLAGMVAAGVVTLLVQRGLWRLVTQRRRRRADGVGAQQVEGSTSGSRRPVP